MRTEHREERVRKNSLALTPALSPRERENRRPLSHETTALRSVTRFAANEQGVAIETKPSEFSSDAAWLTLSPGERAGVRASVCPISFLLFSAALVHAQSCSVEWFTFDGGGGTSTGGVYSVSGTIGQPDAGGPMTGGNFSLTGGFWSLLSVVQTPGAPSLNITLTATNTALISWPSPSTDFVLQQNTNSVASVNWSNVTVTIQDDGTTRTLIVNPPTGNRFYRLFKP